MIGLGSLIVVSLAEAREKAGALRRLVADGVDPLEKRASDAAQAEQERARQVTFAECVERYLAAHENGWKSRKHRQQWASTLTTYANAEFGNMPVSAIDTGLVTKVLEPIWATKRPTASRLRQRIEAVLDWASTRGYREGVNPARWKGHLENLLQKKRGAEGHYAAMDYQDLPAFMERLARTDVMSARCLRFTILTLARTGEVISAPWPEIDFERGAWTVPAERMKAGKPHRVPLTDEAVAILTELHAARLSDAAPIFGISPMTMMKLLKRMKCTGFTVHGFRSTFRTWAGETTDYPREVIEMALAHIVGNKVENAYWRGDMYDKRAKLMQDWAQFATQLPKRS